MENNNQQLSHIIKYLRFPLAVMVVMMHADFEELSWGGATYVLELPDYPFFLNVSHFISRLVIRFAVPLYFIISGFLFFNNTRQFTTESYFSKLRKRINSLLPPYLFWNLEVLFLFFLAQLLIPSLTSGNSILIKDYSIGDWLSVFWTPICGPFWYIRDLFIVIVLSPILYFLIRKCGFLFVIGLGVLWVLDYRHEPEGFNTTSFFFFSLGALFAIKGYDILDFVKELKILGFVISTLLLMVMMIIYNVKSMFVLPGFIAPILYNICILFLIISALNLANTRLQYGRSYINESVNASSFFIYAYHVMPLTLLIKLFTKVFWPLSDMGALLIYLLSPLVTIAFGLVLFSIMKKFTPGFTALITGGRL